MISVHIIIAYYYYLRMCVCMHVMIATFIAIDCRHKLRLLLCALYSLIFKASLCCF